MSAGAGGLIRLLLGAAFELGCGNRGTAEPSRTAYRPVATPSGTTRPDSSGCQAGERPDREIVESVGTGSLKPSIRRVYRLVGEEQERRRILVCREVDTNLDGRMDVVRDYDEHGEVSAERADANYDGVTDTWIRFDKGRISQVDIDKAWDGQPDETRFYIRGKLARIERDTNQDGECDVWEVYADGRLDRMGVDLNHDGRVDHWSRDASRRSEVAHEEKSAAEDADE